MDKSEKEAFYHHLGNYTMAFLGSAGSSKFLQVFS